MLIKIYTNDKGNYIQLDLIRKINAIEGDSGIGKSTIVRIAALASDDLWRYKIESDYKLYGIYDINRHINEIKKLQNTIIFIDEEVEFIETDEFKEIAKTDTNIYVIMSREYRIPKQASYTLFNEDGNIFSRVYYVERDNYGKIDLFDYLINVCKFKEVDKQIVYDLFDDIKEYIEVQIGNEFKTLYLPADAKANKLNIDMYVVCHPKYRFYISVPIITTDNKNLLFMANYCDCFDSEDTEDDLLEVLGF